MSSLTEHLTKTDVVDLYYQQPGLLVNADEFAFNEYKKRQAITSQKDIEIQQLKCRVTMMDEKMDLILKLLEAGK
jgi:hypothetical protein